MARPSRSTTTETPPASLRINPVAPKRMKGVLFMGAMVILIGALFSGIASAQAGDRSSVLAVAKPVPAGHIITAADVETVKISADPKLRPIAASNQSSVIGHTAAVSLVPGTLLTSTAIGPASELARNEAQIGLSLKAGQFPPKLAPGQRVRVIGVDAGISSTLVESAVVVSFGPGSTNDAGSAVVAINVPTDNLNSVASAASSGHVSLGLLAS